MAAHERLNEACPPLWELMLAETHELSSDDQERLDEHVDGCAICCQRLRRADAMVKTVARELKASSWTPGSRLTFPRRRPAPSFRRWINIAAATILILLDIVGGRPQPVEAEQIIERAMAAEQRTPPTVEQDVRIRMMQRSSPRVDTPIGAPRMMPVDVEGRLKGGVMTSAVPSALEQSSAARGMAEGLRAYRFDARRPLSLATFQAWRDSIQGKRDRTTKTRDDNTVLSTTAFSGPVREASLTLRGETYEVIALRLSFDQGELVVEEMRRSLTGLPEPSTVAKAPAPTPEPAPNVSKAPPVVHEPKFPLSHWLDQQYTSRGDALRFVDGLRRAASDALTNVRALHALSESFPRPLEVPDNARHLDQAVTHRYESLRSDLDALNERLGVLYATRTMPGSPRGTGLPRDWRERVAIAREQAETLERMVKQLLERDDLPAADDPVGEDAFAKTFGALWEAINGRTGG
jgi:hypothetical protein